MDSLQIFNYQSNQVRTVIKDGEPWFVAKDVCEILEIGKHRDAISRLSNSMRGSVIVDTPGGKQEMAAVSEAGVYKLVFTSRKPEAEEFTNWLAVEVIPSVRKHGGYLTPDKIEEVLLSPDTVIQLATNLKAEREKRLQAEKEKLQAERELTQQRPKVAAFDTMISSDMLLDMNEAAKILGFEEIGRTNLFEILRHEKIMLKRRDVNVPYQQYMDAGYFEVKRIPDYETMGTRSKTYVTNKGLAWLRLLLRERGYRQKRGDEYGYSNQLRLIG